MDVGSDTYYHFIIPMEREEEKKEEWHGKLHELERIIKGNKREILEQLTRDREQRRDHNVTELNVIKTTAELTDVVKQSRLTE